MSDEELIILAQNGDGKAMEMIFDRYKSFVRKKASSMFILGADRDDLIQEGMIGLFNAVNEYDRDHDASFATFAGICVLRHMLTAVTAQQCLKHLPLNTYISLYSRVGGDTPGNDANGDNILVNILEDRAGQGVNPESLVIDKENVQALKKSIDMGLSSFEKEVLQLYLTGMKYTEIAAVLNKPEKTTDNALQRIRSKLVKIISSN